MIAASLKCAQCKTTLLQAQVRNQEQKQHIENIMAFCPIHRQAHMPKTFSRAQIQEAEMNSQIENFRWLEEEEKQ